MNTDQMAALLLVSGWCIPNEEYQGIAGLEGGVGTDLYLNRTKPIAVELDVSGNYRVYEIEKKARAPVLGRADSYYQVREVLGGARAIVSGLVHELDENQIVAWSERISPDPEWKHRPDNEIPNSLSALAIGACVGMFLGLIHNLVSTWSSVISHLAGRQFDDSGSRLILTVSSSMLSWLIYASANFLRLSKFQKRMWYAAMQYAPFGLIAMSIAFGLAMAYTIGFLSIQDHAIDFLGGSGLIFDRGSFQVHSAAKGALENILSFAFFLLAGLILFSACRSVDCLFLPGQRGDQRNF